MLTMYQVMAARNGRNYVENKIPILDEVDGDSCFATREGAIHAGTLSTASRKDREDFAVIHITYSRELHDKLWRGECLHEGYAAGHERLWRITPEGCRLLNEQADITYEIVDLRKKPPAR